MAETLMHLDGCHFFVWVFKQDDGSTVLTFDERQGTDLRLHRRTADNADEHNSEPCDRCIALLRGAKPRSERRDIDPLPDDPKETFFWVAGVVSEIDEGGKYGTDD